MNKHLLLLFIFTGFSATGQWEILESGSKASFRSIDVVNKKVIWAGGSDNTVIKSTDGGKVWQVFRPELGISSLDFRGIKAFDSDAAIIISAGLAENGAAKIFKTSDGGQNWQLVFESKETGVFLDGIAFFDRMHGMVIGDPIKGEVYILETFDGGETWQRMSPKLFPQTRNGEASFAASNSCLVIHENHAWYAFQSRILHTADRGKTWDILESNFPSGLTNGIFGLRFKSEKEGLILGGDYVDDKTRQVNFAKTSDGGQTWQRMEIPADGLKESAAFFKNKVLIVGTSGTTLYMKGEFKIMDHQSFHAIDCAKKTCFAIGSNGNLGKMKI